MATDLPIDNTVLTDATLLERGDAALTEALGAQGAMKFLEIWRNTQSPSEDAGGHAVGMQVGLPKSGDKMLLKFTKPISWMTLGVASARDLAAKLVAGSAQIERRATRTRALTHNPTKAN